MAMLARRIGIGVTALLIMASVAARFRRVAGLHVRRAVLSVIPNAG